MGLKHVFGLISLNHKCECFYGRVPGILTISYPFEGSLWGTGVRHGSPRPALVKTPGRINLCSWEGRVKSVKSSYTKRLQETEEVPRQACRSMGCSVSELLLG